MIMNLLSEGFWITVIKLQTTFLPFTGHISHFTRSFEYKPLTSLNQISH